MQRWIKRLIAAATVVTMLALGSTQLAPLTQSYTPAEQPIACNPASCGGGG